jgi:origin recognition complex subunit 1
MAPIRKRSGVEKARQLLSGSALHREDSDDELGYEDLPWEWIYDDSNETQSQPNTPSRKRKAAPVSDYKRIIGARMGSFVCKQGDAVFLKAEGNQAWVGIICDLFDDVDEGEKMAKFMWFATEKEIRKKSTKRTDFLPVRHAFV